MIKKIFLPIELQGYYLFKQKAIGIDLKKTKISALLASLQSKKVKEEKLITQDLPVQSTPEQVSQALADIFAQAKNVDQVACSIPNSLVIFKELEFPFLDIEKIKMVLPFELESSIPFGLNNAALSFAVINQDKKTKKSAVMVAITKKSHVESIESLFTAIGKRVDKIIPDAISNYFAIKNILNEQNAEIVVSFEYNATTVTILESGLLKSIRSFPKGIYDAINTIAQQRNIPLQEALVMINNNQIEATELNSALRGLLADLLFTISAMTNGVYEQKKVAIINEEVVIAQLPILLKDTLKLDAFLIDGSSITAKGLVHSFTDAPDFNLVQDRLDKETESLIKKQLIAAGALTISIFLFLGVFTYLELNKISAALQKNNTLIKQDLKNNFDKIDTRKRPAVLIKELEKRVSQEQSIWFAFSKKTKFSFLKYLQELSSIINVQEIQLTLDRIVFGEKSINIVGSVPDFENLNKLEDAINKSEMFRLESRPQDTQFSINLIVKNGEVA